MEMVARKAAKYSFCSLRLGVKPGLSNCSGHDLRTIFLARLRHPGTTPYRGGGKQFNLAWPGAAATTGRHVATRPPVPRECGIGACQAIPPQERLHDLPGAGDLLSGGERRGRMRVPVQGKAAPFWRWVPAGPRVVHRGVLCGEWRFPVDHRAPDRSRNSGHAGRLPASVASPAPSLSRNRRLCFSSHGFSANHDRGKAGGGSIGCSGCEFNYTIEQGEKAKQGG